MRLLPSLVVALVALAASPAVPDAGAQIVDTVTVVIETELGNITVKLDLAHAPKTTANFLRYMDEHFYTDTSFYRTVTLGNQPDKNVKIEVIQGGLEEAGGYPPIELEPTSVTGLQHLDGAISMARDGPDTATSEFFICVGDQPELDSGGRRNADGQGFAAFGRVIAGMDVVGRIHQSPAKDQRLGPPVRIRRITRTTR